MPAVQRWSGWIVYFLICILVYAPLSAYRLAMLGEEPDWSVLDVYQETLSRAEIETALDGVYLPFGYDQNLIKIFPEKVLIKMDSDQLDSYYTLRLATKGTSNKRSPGRGRANGIESTSVLNGLVVAIDPGHIGGRYSEMEGRHFQFGSDPPVKEGDLTLRVSKKLRKVLESNGADVTLVRNDSEPVTDKRPKDFIAQAEEIEKRTWLEDQIAPQLIMPWGTDWFTKKVRERAELLFFRVSEIQDRAKIINQNIRPDLTLAVHFNVSPWPNGSELELPVENHAHVIVNGTYTANELALDDIRLQLFQKLLSKNHEIEIPIAATVATSVARKTNLPAFFYGGRNASNQGGTPYVWARNLLANRIYQGPVVYLEVFASNSRDAYSRIQMGDYEGLRDFKGNPVPSLFKEYVDGVVEGLVDYYSREG